MIGYLFSRTFPDGKLELRRWSFECGVIDSTDIELVRPGDPAFPHGRCRTRRVWRIGFQSDPDFVGVSVPVGEWRTDYGITPEEARFRLNDSGGSSFLCTCDEGDRGDGRHAEWCPRTREAWLVEAARG